MSKMSEIDAASPEEKIKTVIDILSDDAGENARLCLGILKSALNELGEE